MAARKVIHIITRLDWGGSAKNTLLTAMGHDRSRFDPMVIAGQAGRWNAQGGSHATADNCRQLDQAGIPWCLAPSLTREVNLLQDLRTIIWLCVALRRERPAIVHTHTSKAGILGRLAAWIAGVPIVVHTPHGHVFYGHFGRVKSWVFTVIERLFALGTTRMIALTEAEREEHLQRNVGRAAHFAVAPSGIDVEQFRQATATRQEKPPGFDLPPDAVIVGSVGWLTDVKGHRFLLEAMATLKPRYPQLHCVIIGSGPLQEQYVDFAMEHGMSDSIRFLGHRTDVPDCLAAMDIFVLPSLMEGMGRALIEAMAAGLPVIASRVGGIPAIVDHDQTGLLVPSGNAEALADAIVRLLEYPEQAKTLGAAGRHRISMQFDTASMVNAIETVYDEAITARSSH